MARRCYAYLRDAVALRRDESGIALVLVLIIMASFSVMLVTIVSYSHSTQEQSYAGGKRDAAAALAEAGLSDAYSVISQSGTDSTIVLPYGTPTVINNNTQISGGTQTTTSGGTYAWGGVYTAATKTYSITAIGGYTNPSGDGTLLTKTLHATVQIVAPPYTFASLNNSCDKHTLIITLGGTLNVTNGIYVNSCNTGHDAFDVKGSGGSIAAPTIQVVGGWETASGNLVIVNGVTCPLQNSNPPAAATAGCPTMGVPVIGDPYAGKLNAPALGSPACVSNVYGSATAWTSPAPGHPKLLAAITAAQTTITATLAGYVQNGDVIIIDTEDMLVTAGGGTANLTVQRAYNGTTAAIHNANKEIKYLPLTGTQGTAANPAACTYTSGTVTLNPGTYYGGICIGAANCDSSCPTTSTSTATVTMNPGTYIMAGGGFFVCGSSSLTAQAMIYNTKDPTVSTGSGAFEQILLNTTGSVSWAPPPSGAYQGLTIFQDRNLTLSSNGCDTKSSQITQQDIAFQNVASSGANGSLGSISGTIYAPSADADFADYLSGTGNLAILTSCMVIAGGDATFNFQPQGLFGTGDSMKVVSQW